MSSSLSGSRVSSRDRDSSGEITEKDGFSVVAATRITQPFSTPGSRASCCAFVKRWISSRNSTVASPYRSRLDSASSMTWRTSRTPAVTAESSTNLRPELCAIAFAIVVLPVPGGPHRMIEVAPCSPDWSEARLTSGEPGASRCRCPAISSSVRGSHAHRERCRAAAQSRLGVHRRNANRAHRQVWALLQAARTVSDGPRGDAAWRRPEAPTVPHVRRVSVCVGTPRARRCTTSRSRAADSTTCTPSAA